MEIVYTNGLLDVLERDYDALWVGCLTIHKFTPRLCAWWTRIIIKMVGYLPSLMLEGVAMLKKWLVIHELCAWLVLA